MDRPLYPDDIVASRKNPKQLAIVERTHEDVDGHLPDPGRHEPDRTIRHVKDINPAAFKRFMKDGIPPKGTTLVRWKDTANAELISVSKLVLCDRSLLIGDVVKRNAQDAMSGVVLNTFTSCTLQPMCDVKYRGSAPLKGLLPPTKDLSNGIKLAHSPAPLLEVPASELMYTEIPTEEDLVIYRDWIGRIVAISFYITLKLSDGTAVEISEEHAESADGAFDSFSIGDIAMTKKGHLRNGKWIFGQYNPNTHPVGTIVRIRPVAADVLWLQRRIGSVSDVEPPRELEREELESESFMVYDRTRRPSKQPPPGTEGQTATTSNSEIDVRLQLRVRFKDISGACVKYDGSTSNGKLPKIERQDTLGFDINVYDVLSFRTDVTVQWQDQTISRENSIDLIPDSSIDDEHAAWPGEIAHTLDISLSPGYTSVEQPSKVGVIQKVDAAARMANVLWCPSALIQYSVDPDEETGVKTLITGVMGSTTGEVEEVSLYDVEAPAGMNVRRGDVVLIANKTWTARGGAPGPENHEWLGEIVDTCLDGTLIIRLGAADVVQDVKLRREDVLVAIRSDGTDDVDDWGEDGPEDDGMMLDGPEVTIDDSGNLNFVHPQDQDAMFASDDMYDYDSEELEESESEEEPQARYEDENGEPMDEEEVEDEEWESEDEDADTAMKDVDQQPDVHATIPSAKSDPSSSADQPRVPTTTSEQPAAYVVLDQAVPTTHRYAFEPMTESAVHMKRVQKEHRILQKPSAIPAGVYVRTWESRLDLIRVLFIGPSDTPYENAPFLVDLYLPPRFPTEPPQAFFHSWPGESGLGGVGRVNPNLYEDGKICLSLLGTWEGSKGEGWSAARSTILQVIVSILGLVLVKEPYFNEAGYEHLAGLEASKRPSALYNERTYLKAKSFVITALSRLASSDGEFAQGLEGVEDVIRWSYNVSSGPRLIDKVVTDVETVLKSSDEGGQEPDGLTVMSKGACIPLRRVLDRLKQLQ